MNSFKNVIRLSALAFFSYLAAPAVADYSPEFHQLVSEINAQVKTTGPGVTRGQCAPQMFDMAKRGIQDMMATQLLTKVVVEPLENGAKVAAGALGVSNLKVSSYGLVRCHLKEADLDGFKRCALGEALGLAVGQSLETFGGLEGLQNALAGAAWGKTYDTLRAAVENYQGKNEIWDHEAPGECKVNVAMRWTKRREPGAEGGKVWVYARATNCSCPTGASLKEGWLRFTVPVHYTRAGNDQPGWTVGTPREYMLNATCCSSPGIDDRAWLYDSSGKLVGRVGDPERAPAAPPQESPPPRPSPAPLAPPPPIQQWSETNPCPECQPFLDLAIKHRDAAAEMARTIAELRQRVATNQGRQRATQAHIDQLNKEISGKAGEGGSAFDPDSGLTTESWTQPDGSVRITVKDAQGRVIEERTRKRRDVTSLRQRLTQEQEALNRLKQEERNLQNEMLRQTRGRETQLKLEADARAALRQCIAERCGGAPAQAASACSFQPPQSITIGPKEEYGDSLAKAASDKAKGLVGGLIGGFLGGGPVSLGSGGGEEPELVPDPVPKQLKQLFTNPDVGTAIKAGAVPDPKGGMRLSIDVDESKEKGVVHSIARETLDAQCRPHREFPSGYWLYEIWQDWKLSVWWSKDYYVDNQLVKHESGSWFKEGSLMLDRGTFDANDRKYTPWGYFGFERPHKGPRSIGATFSDWKIPGGGMQVPERIVVQVSEPHLDPVTTTAFALYPVYQTGGDILFSPTPPIVNPPKYVGGGMTQIDPPSQPPPKESILDEITETTFEGGAEVIRNPDGTRSIVRPDGTRITRRPDGSVVDTPPGPAKVNTQPTQAQPAEPAESILDDIEPVVGTRVMPDGTRVTTRKDGGAEETWPDGTRVEYNPDGTRLVKQTNGVWIQYRPDGTWVEYIATGRITEYRPDGTIIRQESDGGVIEKKPDGTITHQRADGTDFTRYPDGSTVESRPDGSRTATFADGSSIEHRADGSIHMQEAPKAKPASASSTTTVP